jgi:5-formyltetrahydrofolate cyclo-ligase
LRVTPPDSSVVILPARRQLRRALRVHRASLTASERSIASVRIARHIAASDWLRAGSAVALYRPVADEVPTAVIAALARHRQCRVYAPRIIDYRHRRMVFSPDNAPRWHPNRYGIPEPIDRRTLPARAFRIVFVPVLGFDAAGTRLGYGGGYYDRAFAFRRRSPFTRRPLLIGVAYAGQQLPHIDRAAHDVALDAVVTERGIIRFTSRGP